MAVLNPHHVVLSCVSMRVHVGAPYPAVARRASRSVDMPFSGPVCGTLLYDVSGPFCQRILCGIRQHRSAVHDGGYILSAT